MFNNKIGKIRLYDGTATPYYIEVPFDIGDFDGPLGEPLHDEKLIMHRGKADANMFYIKGSDEKIFEPVPCSFSAMMTHLTDSTYLLAFIQWLNGGSETINTLTMATTKGSSQRISVNTPSFADSNKKTCNLEVLWDGSGTDFGLKLCEVWIPDVRVTEEDEAVKLTLPGQCYGAISTLTAFTSGTDLTESQG